MERLSESVLRHAQGQPEGTPVLAKGLLHLGSWAADYARMVEDGWLLDDAEPFDALMDACQAIEDRANSRD